MRSNIAPWLLLSLLSLLFLLFAASAKASPASQESSDETDRLQGRWTNFTTEAGLPINEIRSIYADSQNNIWFGTRSAGVTRWDGDNWSTWSSDDGLAGNGAIGFIEDADGSLWSLGQGISRFNGNTWQAFAAANGLPLRVVFAALMLQDGSLLFSGNGGVCRGEPDEFALLWHADNGLPNKVAHVTLQDKRGDFWIATRKGLARFDGSHWQTYLHGVNVRSILEDNTGNLWFGTAGKGAIRFDGSNWTTFIQKRTLLADCVDQSGRVWFSSENGGAWSFNGTEWVQYLPPDGPASSFVYKVSIDKEGNLWFATTAGASRFEPTN